MVNAVIIEMHSALIIVDLTKFCKIFLHSIKFKLESYYVDKMLYERRVQVAFMILRPFSGSWLRLLLA